MVVTKEIFGSYVDPATGKREDIYKFKLTIENGTEAHLLSYGATLCGVMLADARGKLDNVVLGFDTLEEYQQNSYFGSTIGRVANRIGGGKFSIGDVQHQVYINNGGNSLHGGVVGWDKRVWDWKIEEEAVVFSLTSKSGDQGYPGTVTAQVRYQLMSPGRLVMEMHATTTATTPINMTNHAFFNLAGDQKCTREEMVKHTLRLQCDRYVPVRDNMIPTGEILSVEGTRFELRQITPMEGALESVGSGGFDHCFVLTDTNRGTLRQAASFLHPPSGRCLRVSTSEAGVQLYTGNFLPAGGLKGRGGASYRKQAAFCCEAQNLPDAVNNESFPCSLLEPGSTYKNTIVYDFSTKVLI